MHLSKPIEGGIYRDPVAGKFKVLATGVVHDKPGFVLKIEDELCIFNSKAWPLMFAAAEQVSLDERPGQYKGAGVHYGVPCQVFRRGNSILLLDNGSLDRAG